MRARVCLHIAACRQRLRASDRAGVQAAARPRRTRRLGRSNPDGPVWISFQRSGHLGILDPKTGKVDAIPLGEGSSPHGVIIGPDGAPWLTDGGQNAIVRVDPKTKEVKKWPLPAGPRLRQPQHSDIREGRRPLVHRAAGVSVGSTRDRRDEGLGCAAKAAVPMASTRRPTASSITRRLPARTSAHRREDRPGHRARAADTAPGRAPRMVRLEGQRLGRGVELGSAVALRPRRRISGRRGRRLAKSRKSMPCTSMRPIGSGSRSGLSRTMMRFDPATEKFETFKSSSAIAPTYARSMVARARCGRRSRRPEKIVVYRYK